MDKVMLKRTDTSCFLQQVPSFICSKIGNSQTHLYIKTIIIIANFISYDHVKYPDNNNNNYDNF